MVVRSFTAALHQLKWAYIGVFCKPVSNIYQMHKCLGGIVKVENTGMF